MTPLVVDASVAFKWLVAGASEVDAPAARALLRDHGEGRVAVHVPALLYYEVGNILLLGQPRRAIQDAESGIADLFRLPLRVLPPGEPDARLTTRLARALGLTFYDATYLALAESLGCDLVTADRRLAHKAARTGRVRILGAEQ